MKYGWLKMKVENILKRIYSIIIVLSPCLMLYKSIFSFMDMGTFLVVIAIGINILYLRHKVRINFPGEWVVFATYMVLGTIIALLFSNQVASSLSMMQRLMKNIMYICILLISYCNEIFDVEFGKKVYQIIVIIATIYIYAQTFFARILNVILWGYFPQFVWKTSYVEDLQITSPAALRPSSLFYEPSHYFIFVFLALTWWMFSEKKCRTKKMVLSIFVSGGIVLSMTSMGILFVALIWIGWIIWQIYNSRMLGRIQIFFCGVCMIGFITATIGLNNERIRNALARVFDVSYTGGNAIAGRGIGYYEITKMPLLNLLFGYGYGNLESNYYPSIVFIFLCTGMVGTALVLLIFYNVFHKCIKSEEKVAFLLYIVLCFYSEIFMSSYLLFFMSFFMKKNIQRSAFYGRRQDDNMSIEEKWI